MISIIIIMEKINKYIGSLTTYLAAGQAIYDATG